MDLQWNFARVFGKILVLSNSEFLEKYQYDAKRTS